jgi:LuxR family maltose regulon positive regulatory protein
MHLVIASRSDPPLMLARLRSQNQMVELRAGDLCFDIHETSKFFTSVMCLSLSDTDIQKLDSRIDGWIAGLQTAGISMLGRADIPGFVSAFTGSSRYIMLLHPKTLFF